MIEIVVPCNGMIFKIFIRDLMMQYISINACDVPVQKRLLLNVKKFDFSSLKSSV